MAKILIVGEKQKDGLREATLELVTMARGLGGEVVSLVIGSGVSALGEELAKKGGGKVLVADDPALENYTIDAYAGAVRKAIYLSESGSSVDAPSPRVARKSARTSAPSPRRSP